MTNANQYINPLIQAVLSNLNAKRDRLISEIDICINKATASNDRSFLADKITDMFIEMSSVVQTLETIEKTVTTYNNNIKQQATPTTPNA